MNLDGEPVLDPRIREGICGITEIHGSSTFVCCRESGHPKAEAHAFLGLAEAQQRSKPVIWDDRTRKYHENWAHSDSYRS